MYILISHRTALQFWRSDRSLLFRNASARRDATSRAERTLEKGERPVLPDGVQLPFECHPPFEVLVSRPSARPRSSLLTGRLWSGSLPKGSFVQVGNGVLAPSPEFLFLLMASDLSLEKLVYQGMELCGTYAQRKEGGTEYNLPPLTCVSKLKAFVEGAAGVRGRKKAAQALLYMNDGSASPRESALYLLLCLPYRLGGYGIEKPFLNYRIDVPMRFRRSASQGYCVCDLCWPQVDVCVEYDSDECHTGAQHISRDSKRRNTLVSMGMTVITVTNGQISSGEALFKIAVLIAQMTGKRLRFKDPEFTRAHYRLREAVLR